jgi:P-type conjugative transfer protein TrbG
VLVKPFAPALKTNLVITTDRRSYHLQLESTARTAMAALSWTYPQDELLALKREAVAAEAATPVASGIVIENLRFCYSISGDNPAWRPLRAFDDGRQTFIEFPAALGRSSWSRRDVRTCARSGPDYGARSGRAVDNGPEPHQAPPSRSRSLKLAPRL